MSEVLFPNDSKLDEENWSDVMHLCDSRSNATEKDCQKLWQDILESDITFLMYNGFSSTITVNSILTNILSYNTQKPCFIQTIIEEHTLISIHSFSSEKLILIQ